jgi:2-keto-3-deoxy-galactonokinase
MVIFNSYVELPEGTISQNSEAVICGFVGANSGWSLHTYSTDQLVQPTSHLREDMFNEHSKSEMLWMVAKSCTSW